MPQTREHLAILDLLQVKSGLVVLSKIDLVADGRQLDMVEKDVKDAARGTVLENARVVRVSARTGIGLDDLMGSLEGILEQQQARPDLGRPRLPVDRVFTMTGFGTVVTGTLQDGSFRVGDEVVLLPGGIGGRVRGLQSHRRKLDKAIPGSRTAINISGVDVEQVQRGSVVTRPGCYVPTQLLDVHFHLLKDASSQLAHNTMVKLFLGAAEVQARVRLLGQETIAQGGDGWLQLELAEAVVAMRGDRYILRRPSPAETLGGGEVLDAHPQKRHKRFSDEVLASLRSLAAGTPADILLQISRSAGAISAGELVAKAGFEVSLAENALVELLESGKMIRLEDEKGKPSKNTPVMAVDEYGRITQRAREEVEKFQREKPLKAGMPREGLKSLLKIPGWYFNSLVKIWCRTGVLVEEGLLLHTSGHGIHFNTAQQAAIDRLLSRFAENPFATPSVRDCQLDVGGEVYQALLDLGQLVQVSEDVVFRQEEYGILAQALMDHFRSQPTLKAGQFRDQFATSRKYALAFLEHMDEKGITRREGDFRRLNIPIKS